ncbi:MAG: SagB/ThcOx family dehydrogenase [Lentimicrobiaceae bacterium]|jgi:SagB-type dehydrogenase family enzyme|nr:SagB/ThcOx family dehydrogenase [Lentimicrobiaceae bacterium]
MKNTFLAIGLFCITLGLQAQNIKLPTPEKTGGKPIMETLNERRSERSYVKKEMSEQMLSNLLWAANGFNRDERRTAPTAMNKQEMELYVMFDSGIYFYDAKANVLKLVAKGDFKEALGQPQISNDAALSIIMVADTNKSSIEWAAVSTGYISQNIYLFAASEGLGTVARGSFKKEELSKALQLKENQQITLVQPVGFLK